MVYPCSFAIHSWANIPKPDWDIDASCSTWFCRYRERCLSNKHGCQFQAAVVSKPKTPDSDKDHKLITTTIALRSGADL
jgi:hypothetical protein